MKSKIFFIVFVTCMVVAFTVYNVNLGLQVGKLSNFTLASVEALAQNENGGGSGCQQVIFQTNFFSECGFTSALLWYDCIGNGSELCTIGASSHFYDCNGSWLFCINTTEYITCD